jgi:hypothetical protein
VAIFNRYPERSYVQAPPLRFDKLGHSKDKETAVARELTDPEAPKNVREILLKVIADYFQRRFGRSPE